MSTKTWRMIINQKFNHPIWQEMGVSESGISLTSLHNTGADPEVKEGGFFWKSARAERAENFWVTTPTSEKPRPFQLKLASWAELNRKIALHARWIELHGEDYTVAKLDWHASAECRTLLGVTKNKSKWISKKGGSFEPNEPPLDPPLQYSNWVGNPPYMQVWKWRVGMEIIAHNLLFWAASACLWY